MVRFLGDAWCTSGHAANAKPQIVSTEKFLDCCDEAVEFAARPFFRDGHAEAIPQARIPPRQRQPAMVAPGQKVPHQSRYITRHLKGEFLKERLLKPQRHTRKFAELV